MMGKISFPGGISETVKCRKFIHGEDIGWAMGCRCVTICRAMTVGLVVLKIFEKAETQSTNFILLKFE